MGEAAGDRHDPRQAGKGVGDAESKAGEGDRPERGGARPTPEVVTENRWGG